MATADEPLLPPTPELLERWAMNQLPPGDAASLEARAAADPLLRGEMDATMKACSAMQAALRTGQCPGAASVSDEQLALYLDGALEAESRAALEVELVRDPKLQARLVALQEELHVVTNRMVDVKVVEKFLAGETLAFERAEAPLSVCEEKTYGEISESDEARKRRYLQFGN